MRDRMQESSDESEGRPNAPMSTAQIVTLVRELEEQDMGDTAIRTTLLRRLTKQGLSPDQARERISLAEAAYRRGGKRPQPGPSNQGLPQPQVVPSSQAGPSGAPPPVIPTPTVETPQIPTPSAVLQNMIENLLRQQTAQAERMAIMESELVQARAESSTLRQQWTQTPETPGVKRYKLPDPDKFGGNKRDWPIFKRAMEEKLAADGPHLGNLRSYIYSRLEGSAAQVANSWLEGNDMASSEQLWELLRKQYADALGKEKAFTKLQTYYQKSGVSLASFNTKFNQLAYQAGESTNASMTKHLYFRAIRQDLRDRMISVEMPEDWDLEDLQNRVAIIEENITRSQVRQASRLPKKDSDAMDWEPTRSNTGRPAPDKKDPPKRQVAAWASKEERDKRRKEGRCIRCGKSGHFIANCRMAPAKRPQSSTVKASRLEEEDEDENSSGERGVSESEN